MDFRPTSVDGAYVIEPKKIGDDRGYFARAWCRQEFSDAGLKDVILQSNMASSSVKGTLRGLHYQTSPHQEVKVIRCVRGSIFDVVVDLRPESKTYLAWFGIELTASNANALYIPEGCATGYLTLEENADIYYDTSAMYAPQHATGVRWNDPAFGIQWPLNPVVISEQDQNWPDFPRSNTNSK